MNTNEPPFSRRLLVSIRNMLLLQNGIAFLVLTSVFAISGISELQMTTKIIRSQTNQNIIKFLNMGELLYIHPIMESTVKFADKSFEIYIKIENLQTNETIAFSGDKEIENSTFIRKIIEDTSVPAFGKIRISIILDYSQLIIKGIGIAMIFTILGLTFSHLFYSSLQNKITKQSIGVDDLEKLIRNDEFDKNSSPPLKKILTIVQEHSLNRAKILALESLASVYKQVAHDIRSPLSALNMVTTNLQGIDQERINLIQNATQRINDIANDLLIKSRPQKTAATPLNFSELHLQVPNLAVAKIEFLPAIIDQLISEKRMQYSKLTAVSINFNYDNGYSAFAKIVGSEISRVLSNLITNSIEALNEKSGNVSITLTKLNSTIQIGVNDNGKGIEESILSQIGKPGFSYGKVDLESGSGLGVFHARKTIEGLGGNFKIESQVGAGTNVKMTLPASPSPPWFPDSISFNGKHKLVTLDDDATIHKLWAKRLADQKISKVTHVQLCNGNQFFEYVSSHLSELQSTTYLVDFELYKQPRTGLELIEELGIEKQAILVTSRFDEIKIQENAARLNLRILPKFLASLVPFDA